MSPSRPSDPAAPAIPPIPEEAFERVLQEAIVRPAGRAFRGEPQRQVELLRHLREAAAPVLFDDLYARLKSQGALRATRDDEVSRRKLIRQAIGAINDKLGTFFFRVRDIRLLAEMFRIAVAGDESDRPAALLQDFFGIRKTSGVRFFATSEEPAGGLTRELYELVTEVRPRRVDVYAASFSSFLGNPEFQQLVASAARQPDGRLRFLVLDPESHAVDAIERALAREAGLRGGMRARIELTLRHLTDLAATLDAASARRLEVRLARAAPLWRFRMVFLPDVLHLRLTVPASPAETLIKLDAVSSLYRSLHDVFLQSWEEARPLGR